MSNLIGKIRSLDKTLSEGEWRKSVVRRSSVLLLLTAPALLFNLILQVAAAGIMSVERFGIFFLSLTIANILAAPSIILSFYVAREISVLEDSAGVHRAWRMVPAMGRRVFRFGLSGGGLVFICLETLNFVRGDASFVLPLAIALLAASTYLVDLLRGALVGLQKFVFLGLFNFGWMGARLLFGLGAILYFNTVWAGLAGLVMAGILVIGGFFLLAGPGSAVRQAPGAKEFAAPRMGGRFVAFAVNYGGFFAIAYLDIVVGYAVLSREALGVYTASAIIPKGILTLTLPVSQVMFSSVIGETSQRWHGGLVTRSVLITTAIMLGGGLAAHLIGDQVCGGAINIGACKPVTLSLMALGMVPIAVLRILILIQFARGADRHPYWLALPAAVFLFIVAGGESPVDDLAMNYAAFSYLTLLFYGGMCLIHARRARNRAS